MLKDLNNLHHAYLVVGTPHAAEESIHLFFKSQDIILTGSPDFFISKMPVFGVDEARALNIQAVRKAFTDRKIFLIVPERITHEAQNALLKTFEEPYPDTHFFLIVREEELVIPTLRSRMEILRLANKAHEANEAENFLKLELANRLEFVKKFVDKERNLSVFLDELLCVTKSKEVYKMRLLSDDRGVAPRLILEHLALVLPG